MAEEGSVIGCHTANELNMYLNFASEQNKLVALFFTSTWCGPCRAIAPAYAELTKQFPDVVFLKVDVNELKRVAIDCEVESLPTIIFLKDGRIVDRVVGARKEELRMKVLLFQAKWATMIICSEDLNPIIIDCLQKHDVKKG